MSEQPSSLPTAVQVAVVMRKERITGAMSQWQPWRWVLEDVVPHEPSFGDVPRRLLQDEHGERWLHPGYTVELFRDEAEGYYLNVHTPAPCWFVHWRLVDDEPRMPEEPGHGALAQPQTVTLSYHEAARWLDAQETVEQVPAPPEVVDWMRAFVDAHYQPEPKKRRRPQSFRSLDDRFNHG
jgi:hypothetical protein